MNRCVNIYSVIQHVHLKQVQECENGSKGNQGSQRGNDNGGSFAPVQIIYFDSTASTSVEIRPKKRWTFLQNKLLLCALARVFSYRSSINKVSLKMVSRLRFFINILNFFRGMGVGREGRGSLPPWILTCLAKKGYFLSFNREKINFTTFGPP